MGRRRLNRANAAVERADRDHFAVLGDTVPAFTSSLAILDDAAGPPRA